MRPKYVEHLMSLEPLGKGKTDKDGKYKPHCKWCDDKGCANCNQEYKDLCVDCHTNKAIEFESRCQDCLNKFCKLCFPKSGSKKVCVEHKEFLSRVKGCPDCEKISAHNTKLCAAHKLENETIGVS